jgi:hypothetical protein
VEIIRLPTGQAAPEDRDCIQVQELQDGAFELVGSVLLQCGDGNEIESVSITGGTSYASYEGAEAAGLAWAAEHCVDTIYVVRSNGTDQLPDIFDSPRA